MLSINRGFRDAFFGDRAYPFVAPAPPFKWKFSVNLWYRDRPLSLSFSPFHAFLIQKIDIVVSRRPREHRATKGERRLSTIIVSIWSFYRTESWCAHQNKTKKYFLVRPTFLRSSFLHTAHHRASTCVFIHIVPKVKNDQYTVVIVYIPKLIIIK